MKRIGIIAFLIICMFQMSLVCAPAVAAQTSDALLETEETTALEELKSEDGGILYFIEKNLHVFILVGAVVGAMGVVTLMYKAKDETKYL